MNDIIDAIWPTIQGPEPEDGSSPAEESGDVHCSNETAEILLRELANRSKEEDDRRARVETKASGLLAAIGLATTVGANLLFAALRADFASYAVKCAAGVAESLAAIGILYFFMAARHSLLALRRATYFQIGPEDLLKAGVLHDPLSLRRRAIREYAKCAVKNRRVTNAKVDHVHLAQLFVRNALVMFVSVAILSVATIWFVPVRTTASGEPHAAPTPTCSTAPATTAAAALPSTAAPSPSQQLPASRAIQASAPAASPVAPDAASADANLLVP